MVELKCEYCNATYSVSKWRKNTSKFCSIKCSNNSRKAKQETECSYCHKMFHLKESSKTRYKRTHGYFCSTKCVAEFRKEKYKGSNNPNYKGKERDYDGYLLSYLPKFGRVKLHQMITFEYLGINKIPEGFQIHHRDCNVNNNDKENLVLLTNSDHRWLHKQFGNATLWAYYHNKIDLNSLIVWSNDEEKTRRLLDISIVTQKLTGVFKRGELLEKPEEVNQQPNLNSNILEGSTTNTRVQTDNAEDGNSDTSALPSITLYNFANIDGKLVKVY